MKVEKGPGFRKTPKGRHECQNVPGAMSFLFIDIYVDNVAGI